MVVNAPLSILSILTSKRLISLLTIKRFFVIQQEYPSVFFKFYKKQQHEK